MPQIGQKNKIILWSFLLPGLFILSCAPRITYYPQLNSYLLDQDYDSARQLVKENKKTFGRRNAVLYYLDEGIIAHFASRYEESNKSLSKAESIMDKLYTKSLSKEAVSFLISDNTIPYGGEDFESALVNLFMALNYAGLGLWEDALVEARKVDNKLNVLNSRYDEGKSNVYKEDAFIRFLMGVLYEAEGEINDAFISYRKAEEIYSDDYLPNYGVSPPTCLIGNLLGSAKAMGFHEEMAEIQRKYPDIGFVSPAEKAKKAEVYFIHYNGLCPEKVEEYFGIRMLDGYIAKIAYPKFRKRSYRISSGKISLKNLASGRSYGFAAVLMEDISSIAVMNLENRIARIKAKAIARATTKYVAAKRAQKIAEDRGGDLAGMLVQITAQAASWATEQADVRHWRSLPAEIRGGMAVIPPGEYQGKIEFVDAWGAVVGTRPIPHFTVGKREKKFFMSRTLN
ncbi:MAG: hypothetical protein HWN68_17400 [Desulfobacterales bacterium]|nr:hypothetical protein [Desulfobacterales bacterium]